MNGEKISVSIPFIGSNLFKLAAVKQFEQQGIEFQSPLSGQICLNGKGYYNVIAKDHLFQSPLSGQICLNSHQTRHSTISSGFNPLYRVKFV